MPLYRYAFKLLDWLRCDADDQRFALAVCLGFLSGVTPLTTLHGACWVASLFVLRVNPVIALVSLGVSAAVFAPFDAAFDALGMAVLTPAPLHRLWAGLYHWPLIPFT